MILMDAIKGISIVLIASNVNGWSSLAWGAILLANIAYNFNMFKGFRNGVGIVILMSGFTLINPLFLVVYLIALFIISLFSRDLEIDLIFAAFSLPAVAIILYLEVYTIILAMVVLILLITSRGVHAQAIHHRAFKDEYTGDNPFHKKKDD